MNLLVRLLVLAGVPVLSPATLEPPSTLDVYAAASLTEAFQELGRSLEQAHPGLTVRFNFAGSQQLALQIEQGAPADVFASADQRWMSYVVEKGQVEGEPVVFARNRLVAIVPRTNPARIGGLQDLARKGTKIVLAAEVVPVGKYSRDALARLAGAEGYPKDYDRRVLANVVSQEENVKSVVAKVQLGEADAGIVYQSDVTPVRRAVRQGARDPRSVQRHRHLPDRGTQVGRECPGRARVRRPGDERAGPGRARATRIAAGRRDGRAGTRGGGRAPLSAPALPGRWQLTRRALRVVALALGAALVLLLGLPLLSLVLRVSPGELLDRVRQPLILAGAQAEPRHLARRHGHRRRARAAGGLRTQRGRFPGQARRWKC